MSWRKLTLAVVFYPILIGCVLAFAPLFIVKLPLIYCEWRRSIRYLPCVGLIYCLLVVPLVALSLRLGWLQILVAAGVFALCGGWLLPDAFTYVLSPRRRRAVKVAIEFFETSAGPPVIYGMVTVVGTEVGRTIVCVPVKSGYKPPARRFVGVRDDAATIEELDFEYVSSRHGVYPWL